MRLGIFYLVTPVFRGSIRCIAGCAGKLGGTGPGALAGSACVPDRGDAGGRACHRVDQFLWLQPETVTDEMLETRVLDVVDRLLARTRFSLFPYLPSFWVSSGLTLWVEGAVMGTFFFGLVLLSHTLFFGYLAATKSGGLFFASLSAVNSRGGGGGGNSWKRGSGASQALQPRGIPAQAARSLGQVVLVGQGGFPVVDRQGHPDVLARHHPWGNRSSPAWPAGVPT